MPTSNFKLFDENKTNAMTDAEYASANQRLNGVQSGIASSKLQNKFQIQMSMVAYAIAQLMVQNGYDATDSTAITTFVSNLSNSVLQKVLDKATTAQAQAGTDNTKWMTPALVKSSIAKFAPMLSTILSNETKALYDLGTSAVPDDVLAELGKYKQYWWQRRSSAVTPHSNYSYYMVSGATDYEIAGATTVYYASAYTVVNDRFILTNPSSVDVFYNRYMRADVCKGKYCMSNSPTGYSMYFVPSTATVQRAEDEGSSETTYDVYFDGCTYYTVTIGQWEYVQSSNRNAYPDSGTSGGYEYEYLGVPFDNAVTAPRIETGSYTGTGSSGSSQKNTLTFDFVPAVVIITEVSQSSFYPGNVLINGQTESNGIGSIPSSGGNYSMAVDWTDKKVSWYAGEADRQLNKSGVTYHYFAIGR